ncbi:ABC transporter substrate-binding protein [Novosphingobium colocasiae]|uniref:ABC transporter substrate-binding protein n=1 Tax=Novosphingobium colocasiae TaxID=1256513 RepID=UPI0035AE01E2
MTSRRRVRIGLLHDAADFADPAPGSFDPAEWIARALADRDEAAAEVELVYAYALGLPTGTAEAVERAFRELADQDVSLIIGPSLADNAIVATALADDLRVPTINWADTARARGRWMYQLPTGSHELEPGLMIDHLAAHGGRSVAVLYEPTPSGTRMLRHLHTAAQAAGITATTIPASGATSAEAAAAIDTALGAQPDAMVHLGTGGQAPALVAALKRTDWRGPAIMNASAWAALPRASRRDGAWYRFETIGGGNRLMAGAALPPDADPALCALGHDLGRLIAQALAMAVEPSRLGLRHALDHLPTLPAAMGGKGTTLGFSVQDHGALHGSFPLLVAPATEVTTG